MEPLTIRALAFHEDGMWVAQCLEFNFVGCAATRDELPDALMRQIVAQIDADLRAGHEPFYGFRPAPQKYWTMLEQVERRSRPLKPQMALQRRYRGRVETTVFPFPTAA
jgi:hypothetical protein